MGAFNYLGPIDAFVAKVLDAPWENPDMVQVFYMEENDERFAEATCRSKTST